MQYKMEELVPIVARLAKGYTSGESTSLSYEKAQQLMGAVLYSIHEGEAEEPFSLMPDSGLSPEKAYEFGAKRVEEKTKAALSGYNELMMCFCSYENECLYDTVAKGIAEFFRWYDWKYEPQNTILTLDYPVLVNHTEYTGIDRIYDYIRCIQLEQKFLRRFSYEYVVEVLFRYNSEYRLMIDNLCEVVLMKPVLGILVGKDILNTKWESSECEKLQKMIQSKDWHMLQEELTGIMRLIVRNYYENDEDLIEYLKHATDSIAVRIKTAADNHNLERML